MSLVGKIAALVMVALVTAGGAVSAAAAPRSTSACSVTTPWP